MDRLTSLSAVTATLLTVAATAAVAQQQYPTPEPRPAPSSADSRALSTDLLTENEVQRFQEMRRTAKTPAERTRVEEQQRAMLNERVLQRTLAIQQPSASTAERPITTPAPAPMPDTRAAPESGGSRSGGSGSGADSMDRD